jgi:hypothetical protein
MSAESFVGFWKFRARASICETPPERQAAGRYAQAEKRQRHSKLTMKMEY